MKWKFKEEHIFEQRCAEAQETRSKYPDRVPVIVEKVPTANLSDIDKSEFLVPADLTVAQFQYIIRKRISLAPEHALFIYTGGILPTTSATMGAIYEEHKDEDSYLYIAYDDKA